MGSGLGYALTGAAIGLGDEIVRRAAEKRELARDILKQRARTDERAEDRKLKLEDRETANKREDVIRAEKRENTVEDLGIREAGRDRRSRRRGLGKGEPLSPGVGFRLDRKLTELNDGLPPSEEEVDVAKDEVKRTLKEAKRNGVQMTEEEAEDEVIGRMMRDEDSAFTGSFRPRGEPVDISHIPPEAIEFLKQNPGLRADFDAQFGPGSAAAVLEGG